MNFRKFAFLGFMIILSNTNGFGQSNFFKKLQGIKGAITKVNSAQKSLTDTTVPKKTISKKAVLKNDSIPKVKSDTIKKLNQQQSDSAFLKHPVKDAIIKFKQDFKKTWNNVFVDFTENETYLIAGLSLTNQNISVGGYQSNFNYDLTDYNKNAFKPGYYAGYRIDGKYKEVHNYSFAFSLNKIAAGANYKDVSSLAPFIGSFSKFKADDQFFTFSVQAHYRKLLPISDTSKFKFYVVAGPSIDTRLSGQSNDNVINGNYHRFLIRGDIGLEFENKSFYTIFIHYKQGITSFTKSPIKNTMNSIDFGLMFKTSDIF